MTDHILSKNNNKVKARIIFTFIAVVCILGYFYNLDLSQMQICGIKSSFDINCPGCGAQRFLHAISHGRFLEAFMYNCFLGVSLIYILCLLIYCYLPDNKMKAKIGILFQHHITLPEFLAIYFGWFIFRNVFGI